MSPQPKTETDPSVRCTDSIRLRGTVATCELADGHGGRHFASTEPPLSAPAVPDTGSWPSLNDVPLGVRAVKDAKGFGWARRSGAIWYGCDEEVRNEACCLGHPEMAPFVATRELDS